MHVEVRVGRRFSLPGHEWKKPIPVHGSNYGSMASTVVVLGNRLVSTAIHSELRGRMDVGIRVFEEADAEHLLLSGGRANPDVPLSECEVMRRYAVENGVAHDEILLEDRSLDTIGNAYYCRALLADRGLDISTVHLVTSCYHDDRAGFVFEQCFGNDCRIETDACYESDAPVTEVLEERGFDAAREFFAPVPKGDLDAIYARLAEAHDLYDVTADTATSRRQS
jgi:vancomycin permeability regulator SanA